jgi:hypothetical protein
MPKPQYPTPDGIWSQGKREEKTFSTVRLGTPYAEAVDHFRQATEGRKDFDPAVLFVWGTMQAKAVLNILKAVEESFGEAGQEVVRKAVNQAGYEAAEDFLKNSHFPEDLDEMELISYLVTGINTVLYASLERPWISTEKRCEFDILWCPHQDVYTAFDCRVQRYFVEGMIRAMEYHKGVRVHPMVEKLIPRGAECCHFVVDKLNRDDSENPWSTYSSELERRALQKMNGQE